MTLREHVDQRSSSISSRCCLLAFVTITFINIGMYVWTQYQIHGLNQRLLARQEDGQSFRNQAATVGMLMEHLENDQEFTSFSEKRIRNRRDVFQHGRGRTSRQREKAKFAAHFEAYIAEQDECRGEQKSGIMIEDDRDSFKLGVVTDQGFTTAGEHYQMWRISNMTATHSSRIIMYNHDSPYAIVKRTGLYLIYSHITFYIGLSVYGYEVTINDAPAVTCGSTQYVQYSLSEPHRVPAPCSTTFTAFLRWGDRIRIAPIYHQRFIFAKSVLSYWGIVHIK